MHDADIALLACPKTGHPLVVSEVISRASDGEIEKGLLKEPIEGRSYEIRDGIPRFVDDVEYNKTWDFKWRVLDGGRGLNYKIIDKKDPAYQIHDLFDRNGYGGAVYERARNGIALDVGCGVGQYSVRLLQEFGPSKLVSLDLTSGVDIFRRIVRERFPHLLGRLLIVQANVFELPFAPATFDFIMSLGVLMHTGDTKRAIDETLTRLKPGGHVNLWIYPSENVAYSVSEPGRDNVYTMDTIRPVQKKYSRAEALIRLFRHRLPHELSYRIMRFVSSDRMYRLMQRPAFRKAQEWFPTVVHPDAAYRLINNYDGYVNTWSDTWSEKEILPILQKNDVVIRDLGDWRLGIWGIKMPGFYNG
jgi:SAM-dependent methyltransferase